MTCLSASFQMNSLGEIFMQKENAGAVAYNGATRESMDGADNLFLFGGNASYQRFERIGFLRSHFNPDQNDDTSQLTCTIGDGRVTIADITALIVKLKK